MHICRMNGWIKEWMNEWHHEVFFYLPALCLVPCPILVVSVFLKHFFLCLLRHCPKLIHPISMTTSLSMPPLDAWLLLRFTPQWHAITLPCTLLDSVFQCPTGVTLLGCCVSHSTSVEPAVSWVVLADQTCSRSMLFLVTFSTK